jgi:hypothetical protein
MPDTVTALKKTESIGRYSDCCVNDRQAGQTCVCVRDLCEPPSVLSRAVEVPTLSATCEKASLYAMAAKDTAMASWLLASEELLKAL